LIGCLTCFYNTFFLPLGTCLYFDSPFMWQWLVGFSEEELWNSFSLFLSTVAQNLFFIIDSFCGAEDETQGLALARQALYH
jgi:hypothetical protein